VLVAWDRAYLAADDWGRYGQRNQVYHRGHECGETGSGVKLHNGRIRLRPGNDHEKNPSEKQEVLITDPYGPPVWAVSLDDAPFVVEMSDEFPAVFEEHEICDSDEGARAQLACTHR